MPTKDFRIVTGYLPEIDDTDEEAERLGLRDRLAVVVDDDGIPQSDFYWALIERILEHIPHESVRFETFETAKGVLRFDSLVGMREYFDAHARDFGTPFQRATLFAHGAPVCLICTEPYAMCGGPSPYHDTWTFAIYRAGGDCESLKQACYQACAEHGMEILEEMHGLPAPRISFSTCLRHWWTRDCYTLATWLVAGATVAGTWAVLRRRVTIT